MKPTFELTIKLLDGYEHHNGFPNSAAGSIAAKAYAKALAAQIAAEGKQACVRPMWNADRTPYVFVAYMPAA